MPTPVVSFFVHGRPRPQGSKRAFPIRNRDGQVLRHAIVDSSGEEGRAWRSQVRDAAVLAWGEFRPALTGPVSVAFTFLVCRPRGHYGTGRNAGYTKPNVPVHPTTPPDLLKLARAVEDSLSSVIYRDDSQIVSEVLAKRYGPSEGVQVIVYDDGQAAMELPLVRQMALL